MTTRNTGQFLLPEKKPGSRPGSYDIYPSFKINNPLIFKGFTSLCNLFSKHRIIVIEGYSGVFFDDFRNRVDEILRKKGHTVSWTDTGQYLKSTEEIDELISPYIGGNDPLFGKIARLELKDFFVPGALENTRPDLHADISIISGLGASLAGWKGILVYIDLPKNEIQFRSRAGSITNLGSSMHSDPKQMYKRFYFVDWIVLNKHKQTLLPLIDVFIDGQHPENPSWMEGGILRQTLSSMSRSVFRARPWFEPGTWGGSWIKNTIKGLNTVVTNYAWSFELISPENGLLIESSWILLEVPFDLLMFHDAEAVLGDCFKRFGCQFPVRFDFLDTFDGGNLSIQCHPREEYMKENFGEDFTQEETYYILDTKDNAAVYLGFQDNIDPNEFQNELERSFDRSEPADIGKFVQTYPASKHDLFLIPPGTVHGSGKNNLVLEISSTPYIFTFKMYDWLRPDLDGKPRPLNIKRGMENLYFERKGSFVREKLISRPLLLKSEPGWELWHLPTFETQLYDIHRIFIRKNCRAEIETENKCHILNLVEGSSIIVETSDGTSGKFSYAETFVIPAAACRYCIINDSEIGIMVIKAFVK